MEFDKDASPRNFVIHYLVCLYFASTIPEEIGHINMKLYGIK